MLGLFLLHLLCYTCRPTVDGPSAEAATDNVEVVEEPTVFLRPDGAPTAFMAPILDDSTVKQNYLGRMQHKCFCCYPLHFMHETHKGRCSEGVARFGQCSRYGKVCLLSSPLPLCLLIFWSSADQNLDIFSSTSGHIMQLFRWHHQVSIERTCNCH